MFRISTRRGKQFNSMIFRDTDMLTGAGRDTVIMSPQDLTSIGAREGDWVQVTSDTGTLRLQVQSGDLKSGTVMMYWPEANAVIPTGTVDPECGMPAYRDAVVKVTKVS